MNSGIKLYLSSVAKILPICLPATSPVHSPLQTTPQGLNQIKAYIGSGLANSKHILPTKSFLWWIENMFVGRSGSRSLSAFVLTLTHIWNCSWLSPPHIRDQFKTKKPASRHNTAFTVLCCGCCVLFVVQCSFCNVNTFRNDWKAKPQIHKT